MQLSRDLVKLAKNDPRSQGGREVAKGSVIWYIKKNGNSINNDSTTKRKQCVISAYFSINAKVGNTVEVISQGLAKVFMVRVAYNCDD